MYAKMLLIAVGCGQILQTASPANAAPASSPPSSAAPNGVGSAPDAPSSESIEVRYARALLRLAEANLQRVEASNKRVAGTVPKSVIAEYEDDVQIAKSRLEQADAGDAAKAFQAWLARAEAEERAAQNQWKVATAVNAHRPGAFDALDVERFRLRAEVAQLQLERGRTLVAADSEAQLQWAIELVDNQLQWLKEEARRPTSLVPAYPYWGW